VPKNPKMVGNAFVADMAIILNKLTDKESFARDDVQVIMEEIGYHSSSSSVNRVVNQLLAKGDIARVGRNRFIPTQSVSSYHYSHSDCAVNVAESIQGHHPYVDFRLFELVQLNEFVNHQIGKNIIFVSVESELEEDVFNTLWNENHGSVLLKPKAEDLFRYMTDDMVVISRLPSESPRGTSLFWDTRIEKILVDIAVDKLLRKVVYSSEYPEIFREVISKYAIDKSTMTRYLRRRGAMDKFRKFLVDEACISAEQFSI